MVEPLMYGNTAFAVSKGLKYFLAFILLDFKQINSMFFTYDELFLSMINDYTK